MDGELDLHALLRSYLPDWPADAGESDPARALLEASTPLFERTDALIGRMMEKHRAVFLDMLAGENQPGRPACGWVRLLPAPDAATRVLPAGTRFVAETGGTVETAHAVCLSANRIERIELVEPAKSLRLTVPAMEDGSFPSLCPGDRAAGQSRQTVWRAVFADGFFAGAPFLLRPAPVCGEPCEWTLQSADGTETLLAKPEEGGVCLSPVDQNVGHAGETIVEGNIPASFRVSAEPCAAVLPACERPPDAVLVEENPADGDDFMPFGDRLQLESCCYLACDALFGRVSSVIEAGFALSLSERAFGMELLDQTEPEYRLVMRRMPEQYKPPVYHAVPQQVVWEYWNGQVWTALPGCERQTGLFAQAGAERARLKFSAPKDWERIELQGRNAFWLRLRLKRADDCYGLPCRQMVPRVRGLTFRAGELLLEPRETRLDGDGALDGLPTTRPPVMYWKLACADPIQLLWCVEDAAEEACSTPQWEYGLADGSFRPLAMADGTGGLRRTGTLAPSFPAAFARSLHFGESGFWLRVWNPPQTRGALYSHAVWARAEQMGDVPAGALQPWEQVEGLAGAAILGAFGGDTPPETDEQARRRAGHGLYHQFRAVTAEDVSILLRDAFREVAFVTCGHTDLGALRVAVLLRDNRQTVFEQIRERMERFLKDRLPLGVGRTEITEPDQAKVCAAVAVAGIAPQDWPMAEADLQQAFEAYLDPLTGGGGGGWPLGVRPTERQVADRLDQALRKAGGWVETCRLFVEEPEAGQTWCAVAAGELYARRCEEKGAE